VAALDAESLGRAAMLLGAGRTCMEDEVDPGAGLIVAVRVGDSVQSGDPLCTMFARSPERLDAAESRVLAAVRLSDVAVNRRPLVVEA
jgi:pyrimidine-nucleoside phosphorylase